MRSITWLAHRGSKIITYLEPLFVYSLCNFHGATMTIKGRLRGTILPLGGFRPCDLGLWPWTLTFWPLSLVFHSGSRDTAHVHWLKTHFQCYPMGDIIRYNSGTNKRNNLKLSGGVDHVTRYGRPMTVVKRSKFKVTSQGHKAENRLMVKLSPANDP